MSEESKLFTANVPKRAQVALLRAVFDGCKAAYDSAKKNVAPDWFGDAIPQYRRLAVEPLLSGLVLPKGLRSSIKRTTTGTRFTCIESDRVVLTALTRSVRRSSVPPEPYRVTLAEAAQLMFKECRTAKEDENARLYALLMYGGPHNSRFPTLAEIVFPLPSGELAPGSIDLMTTFADVVSGYLPKPATEPVVSLREVKRAATEDDEGA